MTKVGIIGARKYKDRQSIIELIETLTTDCIVVTSSCRGVCTWAGEAANARGLEVEIFAPDLTNIRDHFDMVERYYERNRQLISACDIVHAFISRKGGLTGGTRYEVRYAKTLGKDLFLHWEGGKVQRMQKQASLFDPVESDFSAGWMSFFSETLA
jgi:nucleoside 2-deoxyribosyltransferase